jgi:hypothetical protein
MHPQWNRRAAWLRAESVSYRIAALGLKPAKSTTEMAHASEYKWRGAKQTRWLSSGRLALISVGLIAAYSYEFPPSRPGADQVPQALVHSVTPTTTPLLAHNEISGIATAPAVVATEPADKEASSIAQASLADADRPGRRAIASTRERRGSDFPGWRERDTGRFSGRGDDDDADYEHGPPAGPLGLLFGFR